MDQCCKSDKGLWKSYGQDPPCEVCPLKSFELTYRNQVAFDRWSQLDFTGRRYGMSVEPLNDASIDANLTRYGCNEPLVYEVLLQIESRMFKKKMEEQDKKREEEQKKREHDAKMKRAAAASRNPPRRSPPRRRR